MFFFSSSESADEATILRGEQGRGKLKRESRLACNGDGSLRSARCLSFPPMRAPSGRVQLAARAERRGKTRGAGVKRRGAARSQQSRSVCNPFFSLAAFELQRAARASREPFSPRHAPAVQGDSPHIDRHALGGG